LRAALSLHGLELLQVQSRFLQECGHHLVRRLAAFLQDGALSTVRPKRSGMLQPLGFDCKNRFLEFHRGNFLHRDLLRYAIYRGRFDRLHAARLVNPLPPAITLSFSIVHQRKSICSSPRSATGL
jgi:hypothetical protein